MTEKIFNKLVRDKIPDIIRKNGEEPLYEVLDKDRYLAELDKKLAEECAEYEESRGTDELADIIEVIYAICAARGISPEELDSIRTAKKDERGGFENRIFLAGKLIKADK